MDSYERLLQIGFQPNGALTAIKIMELESEIHFNMPQDYRQFMMKSNGGRFLANTVCFIKVNDEEILLDSFLSLGAEARVDDIVYWYKTFGDEYEGINTAQSALSDPGIIVLHNEPGQQGVYLWDDSLELETSTEDNCMYKIADSFEEFVSKIYVEEI